MSEFKNNPIEKRRTYKKQSCRCSNGDTVELLFNPKAAIKVFCTECMGGVKTPLIVRISYAHCIASEAKV